VTDRRPAPDAGAAPTAGIAPDGRPYIHPTGGSSWRAWLIENHASTRGVYLAGWRRSSGHDAVDYVAAVEDALCVGWIDSKAMRLPDGRSVLWFSPRKPNSGWARTNKERVARLMAEGRMLPAGLASVEDAKRRGTWTMLDDVERLIVPDDLGAALDATPGARANWDAFPPSVRRQYLVTIVTARRPETRTRRVTDTAERAALNVRPGT